MAAMLVVLDIPTEQFSYFYLQATPMLLPSSISFQVKKRKNSFSRWRSWRPSWISNKNAFNYFNLLVTLMLPIKYHDSWPFVSGEKANIDCQDGSHLGISIGTILAMAAILDFEMLPTKFDQVN